MSVTEDMLSNYGGFDENSLNNIIAPDGNINKDDNNDLYDLIIHYFYYSDEQILSHLKERRQNFSISSMNIASLNTKFDQLKIYVELLKTHNCEFSIICLHLSLYKKSDIWEGQFIEISGSQ